jgi:hypothetical protein
MGQRDVMPGDDSGNGNLLVSQKATLANAAVLKSLSFYVTTAAGNLRLGVYDATGSNGGPGTKLAETADFTPTAGWNTAAVATPVALPAGNYWLAYLPSSSSLGFRVGNGGEARWQAFSYGPMPAKFPSTSLGDAVNWSLYATLDVTDSGSPPPAPGPSADTESPAKPVLSLGQVTQTSAVLIWQPGVDNVGVDHYNIWLDSTQIAETTSLTWTYTGLTCGTSYLLGLEAEDAAGNKSVLGDARWGITTVACAQPPASGYPDASNTGVPLGTPLTVVNGNMTIATAGTIIENRDIRGCVVVNAPDVIIRKSRIACGGQSVVWSGSTNLLVEDVEIVCGGTAGTTGLTPQNYTARRVNAHACENIFWASRDVTVIDSYLHDPIPCCGPSEPHTDSVQLPGGASNVTLRHNTIYGGYVSQSNFGNSAFTTGGSSSSILIENNLLAGGGHTARCEGSGANTNYRVKNNRFSRIFTSTVGGFGPVSGCDGSGGWPGITEWSGNVYHESGAAIP